MNRTVYSDVVNCYGLKMSFLNIFYCLLSGTYIFVAFIDAVGDYKIYMYWLMIIYIVLFCLTLRERNFSLYQVFLCTLFVFILARIFLNCFSLADMKTLDLYESAAMSDDLAKDTLRVIGCFLIATSYAWMLNKQTGADSSIYSSDSFFRTKTNYLNPLILVGFAVFAILAFIKAVWLVLLIVKSGYGALFNSNVNVSFPSILNGAIAIFYIFFAIVLYYNREKKYFIRFAIIYLVISTGRLFGGARAAFFCNLLFLGYLWSMYYKEIKIINIKTVTAVATFPVIAEAVSAFRFHIDRSIISMIKDNVFFSVMRGQGISLTVVANTIKHLDDFSNKVPFLIGYFTDFFQSEPPGQVIEDIKYGNYLGDHLTYMINPSRFLGGSGTGTSIIAEIYEFVGGSVFLLFIVSFLLYYVALRCCRNPYSSIFRFSVSYFLAIDLIFSPRGSLFTSMDYVLASLVLCCALKFFENKKEIREEEKNV